MTALETATNFLNKRNPDNNMRTADFREYRVALTPKFSIELMFIEEDFDGELQQRIGIDLTDNNGCMYDYTFSETTSDAQIIADDIDYLLHKWHDRIWR